MAKFNLSKVTADTLIQTKEGKEAKILTTTRNSKTYPLVVILDNNHVYYYTTDGKFFMDKDSENDLIIK